MIELTYNEVIIMKNKLCKGIMALTVAMAVLMGAGCDGGEKKPMETTAVTEKDPDLMETPDFSGLSLEQIQMKYPKLNILPEYEYSDDIDEGGLISQSPEAGTEIYKNDKITVVISSGSKLVEIDDYTNRNIDDAEMLIKKQGLEFRIIKEENETVTANCIIKTDPPARSMVEKGTVVTCYVSLGSAEQELLMPDLVGKTIEEATKLAGENGVVLSISYDNESEEEPGTVISQSLDPDEPVEPDTKVEVVISGESTVNESKTTISVSLKSGKLSGEYELKYYIDGTLQEEKTEIKELSLTKKIEWEVKGKDVHTYSIVVTYLKNGKSGKLYEMEVDFTQNPPKKDHHGTFNAEIFEELKS